MASGPRAAEHRHCLRRRRRRRVTPAPPDVRSRRGDGRGRQCPGLCGTEGGPGEEGATRPRRQESSTGVCVSACVCVPKWLPLAALGRRPSRSHASAFPGPWWRRGGSRRAGGRRRAPPRCDVRAARLCCGGGVSGAQDIIYTLGETLE